MAYGGHRTFYLFCFAKSRICAYFTVYVQIMRIHKLCFILREFCSKVKPQKERWNFPFILARARSRLCRKFKLAARWVKLSAEARTLVADVLQIVVMFCFSIRKMLTLIYYWFPESRAQSQLPYKKWALFSNFQVQRDSPPATYNLYILCLNRR